MNAELRAVAAADERKRAAGMQAAKAAEKRRDLSNALESFFVADDARVLAFKDLQELGQAGREYSSYLPEIHTNTFERLVFAESIRITCNWALDVTDIMLSLMEVSNERWRDAKKSIDAFTGKISNDHLLLRELNECASYQKLLRHKHDRSQFERKGASAPKDTATTKERTADAQAAAEAVQKNAEGNAPEVIKETNRDKNRHMSQKGQEKQ